VAIVVTLVILLGGRPLLVILLGGRPLRGCMSRLRFVLALWPPQRVGRDACRRRNLNELAPSQQCVRTNTSHASLMLLPGGCPLYVFSCVCHIAVVVADVASGRMSALSAPPSERASEPPSQPTWLSVCLSVRPSICLCVRAPVCLCVSRSSDSPNAECGLPGSCIWAVVRFSGRRFVNM